MFFATLITILTIIISLFVFNKKNNTASLTLLIIIILSILITSYIYKIDICFSRITIGIPCPGCGITRSYVSLLSLDFKKAFMYHPLFLFPPIAFCVYLFSRYKKIHWYKFKIFWIVFFAIYIVIWIFRMILYFPETEPLDYNNNSLLNFMMEQFRF